MVIDLAPKRNREVDVEGAVCRYAASLGWIVKKYNSPARIAEPDRIFFRRGKVVLIEFKKNGEDPTKAQQRKLDEYTAEGFLALGCDNIKYGKGIFDAIERGAITI